MIDVEQYMDFLRNRTFRQTLLVHEEVEIQRELRIDPVFNFWVSTSGRFEEAQPDLVGSTHEKFVSLDGSAYTTNHPITKFVLAHLSKITPRRIPFDQLWSLAQHDFSQATPRDRQILAANLLQMYCHGGKLIFLGTAIPQLAAELNQYPIASHLARMQLKSGTRITNFYHESINLQDITLYILPMLDGKSDRSMLVRGLLDIWQAGRIGLRNSEGQPIVDHTEAQTILETEVDFNLNWLLRMGFLVG